MYNSRKELLLLGDFNMDLYNNTAEARAPNSHLVDFCERFRLVNNIPEPTRVTSTTKRLIDVALTSNLERFSTSGTLPLSLSDQDFFTTHPSVKLIADRDTLVNLNFVPVSSSYVSTILHNLDSKKAVGVYGISSFFLRLSAPGIVNEITKLINFFINSQSWPQEWKCSIVTFSFLGPLLFNIFINDLNFFFPHMSLRFYADDTTGYYSDTCPTVLQVVVNSELCLLSSWFDENHLLVSNDKTQALLLGPCSYKYDITLKGIKGGSQESMKILGVTLDKMLTLCGGNSILID